MPDILYILTKWWKTILALTVVAALLAAVVVLFQPKQYASTLSAMPASSVAYDKAKIFNENIEGLYSALGHPEDLDKVIATAVLDTIYINIAQQEGLVKYYRIKGKNELYSAALQLKGSSKVYKSEYGDLKVKVWDTQPEMAAHLANVVFQKLQELQQDLQSRTNTLILDNLKKQQAVIQEQLTTAADSLHTPSNELAAVKLRSGADQLQEYEKLISEYELMINTKPQVLLLVESARPALSADKPRLMPALLMAVFAALLFGSLLAIFLETRKTR